MAAAVSANSERLVEILIAEVGKPIREARNEVDATSSWFSYTASLLETLTDEIRYTSRTDEEIWTRRLPHGVVGAIIPWNFPSALVSRKVGPAIGAGNSIVLKADEKTPLSALALAEVFAAVPSLPPGVVNIVTGAGSQIGRALVDSDVPNYISMTGSAEAGKSILDDAARSVKPVSLELGGKAPLIVFPDVDLDKAVAMAVESRHMNCGQVCIAAERTFVHHEIYDAFVERYIDAVDALVVGPPANTATVIGPKISEHELAKTIGLVQRARDSGSRVVPGGARLDMKGDLAGGYWMAPTVILDADDQQEIMQEEVFGPVTPITPFNSWDEVVARSNDTRYGLSAYLFTNDLTTAIVPHGPCPSVSCTSTEWVPKNSMGCT